MRTKVRKTLIVVAFAVIFLFVLPVATMRSWMSLEEGAYRSPLRSDTEELTPRQRWLLDQAVVEAEQAMEKRPEPTGPPVGEAVAGAELFEANGCYACHSLEGERKIGPSLRGIFGTTVELNDGSTVAIDEAYLVESILYPEAKRVAGYDDAAMPSYEGLLSSEDVWGLAGYIKGLE